MSSNDLGCLTSDVRIVPGNDLYEPIIFNTVDLDGTRWWISEVEGWWTLPPVSLPDYPRPQRTNGSYDVIGVYQARTVTIRGNFLPPNRALVPQKRQRLLQALDSVYGDAATLIFNEPIPKQAYARLSDQPMVRTTKTTGFTEFEFTMRCADPLKYSLQLFSQQGGTFVDLGVGRTYSRVYPRTYVSSGSGGNQTNYIVALNEGSVPTAPLIAVNGPATNPVVTNLATDEFMGFNLTLASNERLLIDMGEHIAIKSAPVEQALTISLMMDGSTWWKLLPGVNNLQLVSESNTGSITATWRSAWLE